MVFSSMVFLCFFFPITYLLYQIIPNLKLKNFLLIIVSLLFYAYGEPYYVLIMLVSIFTNYCFGILLINKEASYRRIVVTIAVLINLGILGLFKYADMIIATLNTLFNCNFNLLNIPLPIGISFFTFQAMSYVIDVYRKDVLPERNIFNVMLYISFFPQLIAGPIVKYHDIDKEIRNRHTTLEETAKGFRRFIIGLSKKVLIANVMAKVADTIYVIPSNEINICLSWLGAISYLFQIYFDFSGYSDMAIGLGEIFGFHFKENFNYPYISTSIKEFWRRWHISLSTWFKEYLYIPLGGNRKGKLRTSINKIIVFFSTGLWHGANFTFILWGLWHGFFMLLEERAQVNKLPKILQHIYTLLVVIIGFVMFRAESVGQGLHMIKQMFFGWKFGYPYNTLFYSQLTLTFIFSFVIATITSGPIIYFFEKKNQKIWNFLSYACCFCLLLICILNLSSNTYNPFIYFRF